MFSKYTCKQPDTGNVNQCGGYALAALIHASRTPPCDNQPNGSDIYNQVIAFQNDCDIPLFSPKNQKGARSLPSSLIKTAKENGFTRYKLTVTKAYGQKHPELITSEKGRLNKEVEITKEVKITEDSEKTLDQLLKKDGYYLVLVNDGNHWIAMGKRGERVYFYDPGGAGDVDETGKPTINFSGVIIRLN
ncbi:hypothetical protein [Leminorella grimontii]|uniref:hypothetical protein n=1 Tax=Leminorella grimontii TaxID=82981 RepID=UPI00321FFF4C